MSVLAIVRPDDWNLPLFVHLLGVFTLVGALVTAGAFLFLARRDGSAAFTRLGYRTLLMAALPAFVVGRIGAQWIANEEGLEDSDAAWITIGYVSTDAGALLLIGATVAAGLAARRGRNPIVAAYLVALLIVIYAVVIWVMTTKPA